jgi:5-methyltetrahydropteroyltriglutamate--homocysteine methyltransferase
MQGQLLCTTVVGSYPQPDWLIDRQTLGRGLVRRVPARELWRIPDEFLEQAQDDATLLAVRAMEQAGIDIISDGEARRESYSNRFATALDGVDTATPGTPWGGVDRLSLSPEWSGPFGARDLCRCVMSPFCAVTRRPYQGDHPWAVYHESTGSERLLSRRGKYGSGLCRSRE